MNNKGITATLLAIVIGAGASSHAQAAAIRTSGPRRDAHTAHATTALAPPEDPEPWCAWNSAWSNMMDALRAAGRALVGSSAVAGEGGLEIVSDQLFDAPRGREPLLVAKPQTNLYPGPWLILGGVGNLGAHSRDRVFDAAMTRR